MKFIYSIQSEWMKTKRSAASWLCIIGGSFIPLIYLIGFLIHKTSINTYGDKAWEIYFSQLWQNMSSFLLPMGIILASSLITQLEYKNNTWKQLHATPQTFTNVFFAKFTVIMFMTIKFFIYFNIGILISGVLPSLIFNHKLPANNSFPILFFLKGNVKYFIVCLPILAIQYLISLKVKNFLAPVGIGLLGIIGSLIAFRWKYIYFSPYSFCIKMMFKVENTTNLYGFALLSFAVIMVGSYFLYLKKKEKG